MAAAQGAVVVEGGEGKLLKGEGAEAGEGFGDGKFAFGDVREKKLEFVGVHDAILAWGSTADTAVAHGYED